VRIAKLRTLDMRFPLSGGAGSDSVHVDPVYSFATCVLETDEGVAGTGFAFTVGRGNDLVCDAIRYYEPLVVGLELEEVVARLGYYFNRWANESQLRWLGPQKGVVHLALAALQGAIVDLWAKAEQKPLWRLLLDLAPEQVVELVDFSTISDYLGRDEALDILRSRRLGQAEIDRLNTAGYPAYDTSVGWLGYSRDELVNNALLSVESGYSALKLKVGKSDLREDALRVEAVRNAVGEVKLMIDANQCWDVPQAIEAGHVLADYDPYWLEEPVHPDDILGYRAVADALAPMRIAGGEHCSNQVLFKNFIRAGALHIVQPDAVRLAGLPEYLAVSLMAAKAGLVALPHVGDMAQLHQHLIVFTRCALGMPELPLEMIPHIAPHFAEPCQLKNGAYVLPNSPGASTTFTDEAIARHCIPSVKA
jgi:L-fuconate dehydratase